ncbi:MAG TPA: C40 family peptidase [Segetibacter sp.]|jgi:cell wall-associated NlpC family hydrolase
MKTIRLVYVLSLFVVLSCNETQTTDEPATQQQDTLKAATNEPSEISAKPQSPLAGGEKINTGEVLPESLIAFAQTLIGTTYKYGSTDPAVGFDCSGFITHVFNHFDIKVPRSSRDFEFSGTDVPLQESKPGDLILFTGTDSTVRTIGHMGIIIKADGTTIDFIHSSSGKANGVVVTPLNGYYMGRFMKVVRVFS